MRPGAGAAAATTCAFPTYRQQGLLIARGYPLVDMMSQIYSNARDPHEGPPAAGDVLVQARTASSSISGNLGTQYQPGGGLGDGLGLQGRRQDRLGLDRRRRDRRGRLPQRADLRLRLPRAGDPQHRQQPVGDLARFQGIAGGERHHLRRARHRLRHAVAARRRQRLPGGLCGDAMGGRAGPRQPRGRR